MDIVINSMTHKKKLYIVITHINMLTFSLNVLIPLQMWTYISENDFFFQI